MLKVTKFRPTQNFFVSNKKNKSVFIKYIMARLKLILTKILKINFSGLIKNKNADATRQIISIQLLSFVKSIFFFSPDMYNNKYLFI